MAFQGFTIVAFTVGLASLLYYFLANNGRQEQSYGYRSSGGRNGPDNGASYNFTTAGSSSSNKYYFYRLIIEIKLTHRRI